jgi:dihydrodipicolinate synthase/N-acetylneuraminate lyase
VRFGRDSYAGVWVPLVTPFRNGEPDLDMLARLVDWLLERGVHGLVALGSTGERPHLSEAEAAGVVQCVVETVRGRVPVMAGAGNESTREALRTIDSWAKLGADAAIVLTPFYYRTQMSAAALGAHYAEVATNSPIPVFIYHFPQVTGIDLEPEWMAEVLAHPNLWGFKDSSAQGGPLVETMGAIGKRGIGTRAFVGSAARVLDGLEAGACGGILAVAHVLPEIAVRLMEAFHTGTPAEATELQAQLAALTTAFGGRTIAGVKCGLRLRGMDAGAPRPPLEPVPPEAEDRIAAVLAAALSADAGGRAPA